MNILTIDKDIMEKKIEDTILFLLFQKSIEYLFQYKNNNNNDIVLLKPSMFCHELLKTINYKHVITEFSSINKELFNNSEFETKILKSKNLKFFNKKISIKKDSKEYIAYHNFEVVDFEILKENTNTSNDEHCLYLNIYLTVKSENMINSINLNKYVININLSNIIAIAILNGENLNFKSIINLRDLINRKTNVLNKDQYEAINVFN